MKLVTDAGVVVDLGTTETAPTVGITDYSRRVTDDFGVTTVVRRNFSRRMSLRFAMPFDTVDAVQARMATMRATPALWVADDRYRALSVRGIYKDFEIDLSVPPTSFCTLTVDGMAETDTLADPGGDAAPEGAVSTLRLLQPVEVTDAVLTASNVAEADAPAWSAEATYADAARVMVAHRVYESLVAANRGNDPVTSGKWVEVGPTNRWAMFDEALGSVTSAAAAIVVTLAAGAVDTIALLDVKAATVRVQAAGYDRVLTVAGGAIVFDDVPATAATVTIAGAGTVSVGTLLIGRMVGLGITEASPTAGITDYSRKEVDDFGDVTIVQRAWSKRMTAKALIRSTAIDAVFDRIASVRARPSLWIGDAGSEALTIYGFFKDFSIEVGENVSKLSLSIEGLSAGAPAPSGLTVKWPDITDPVGTKPADNATNSADKDSPFGPDGTVGTVIDRLAGLAGAVEILADTPDADKLLDGAKALVDRVRVQQVTQLADQLLAETRKQLLDERTHVDGIPTGTQIKRIDREWREGDSLLAETISSVSTAIDTVDGRLTSEVVRLDQARIDGDTVQATALSNVRAELEGDIAGVDGRVTGEVTRLEQAIVDGDGAQATALSNVRAELEGDIAGVDGRVTGEVTRLEQAIVDGDGAQATALSNVRAELEGDIAGVDGRVTGEVTRLEQAIVDGDGAQATALSNVKAELEGDIAGVDGRVTGEVTRLEQAIVDGDGAQATAIEQVRATVGDVQATVTQQAAAIVDIEGKVMAYLLFEVEAGTGRAVVRLAADGRDGSTIDFAANALRFANPVDGRNITAMQVAGGNVEVVNDLLMGVGGHIISRSGAYMQVNGAPFGSQSQFVEWYGPVKASLAECTAADAISYKTVNGSAYFGGSLTAGVLRNAVRTSTLIGTANVTTGTFGSNGGPRVVVVSLNFAGDLQITGACPVAQQPSARVQLWRGVDAATGVLLSEQVMYGTHECDPGFGAGEPGSIVDIVSGSFTYTDNTGGTTAAYFARIVDRTTYVVPTRQELALVSVEE